MIWTYARRQVVQGGALPQLFMDQPAGNCTLCATDTGVLFSPSPVSQPCLTVSTLVDMVVDIQQKTPLEELNLSFIYLKFMYKFSACFLGMLVALTHSNHYGQALHAGVIVACSRHSIEIGAYYAGESDGC